jgi:hypothetical protein
MYSMEQKRAAIETYIRFDHSSADMIAKLGYPSRTMLKDVAEEIREDGQGPGKGTAHPCIQRRADAVRRLVLPGARKEPLEDEAGHGISEVERDPREMDRRARAREEEGV